MIASSGLAVEGGHGLGHSLHLAHPHMAYGAPPPVPEFLRPLPKPAPLPPPRSGGPVNLAAAHHHHHHHHHLAAAAAAHHHQQQQHKEEEEFLFNTRFYAPPPPPHLSHYPSLPGPYGSLYPGHYTPLLSRDRPGLPLPPPSAASNPPLSPLEAFPSPHSAPNSPAATYSPPSPAVKAAAAASAAGRDRRFKVPSGKEGSLKHRILTTTTTAAAAARPEPTSTSSSAKAKRRSSSSSGLELQPASFSKGSLIQLANGELRRVEDMRTEDFVSSAERSPALRLDPSTVVRIEPGKAFSMLTLSYGLHRTQVELESAVEQPYFVFGQGWASCSPDRTLAVYGLKCHRLQVGDVCISLTPRPAAPAPDAPAPDAPAPDAPAAANGGGAKKRRWSAPDQYEALTNLAQPARKAKD